MADAEVSEKMASVLGGMIAAIFIIFAINGYIEKGQILQEENENTYKPESNEIFGIGNLFKSGDIKRSSKIISERPISVRADVGGAIIGEQKVRSEGQVLEGPVEGYGGNWWKVNFIESPDGWVLEEDITTHTTLLKLANILPILYELFLPVGIVFSIIAIILIIIIRVKFNKVIDIENKKRKMKDEEFEVKSDGIPLVPNVPNLPVNDVPSTVSRNPKWDHIQDLIRSNSMNDWRQAIIEADIILDDMLDRMGYTGESVGEKLKSIERSDFITIDQAWEAHKVRNRIAHDGSDFKITRANVENTIRLYERVFKEFYYI